MRGAVRPAAVALAAWLVSLTLAFAIDDTPDFEDPALQARYERLTEELRCLVCQNQTIADSNATLAADLRLQVREMLADGATDAEILDFMVARYGDFVRYRPPWAPRTWLLWTAPAILLAIGLIVVARVVSRRAALYTDDPSPDPPRSA